MEKQLYAAILTLENPDEVRRFLRDLLTETEIEEFSRRFAVAAMLQQNVSYKKIEAQTGMSSRTIARVSQFLRGVFGGYQLVLNRLFGKHHQAKT